MSTLSLPSSSSLSWTFSDPNPNPSPNPNPNPNSDFLPLSQSEHHYEELDDESSIENPNPHKKEDDPHLTNLTLPTIPTTPIIQNPNVSLPPIRTTPIPQNPNPNPNPTLLHLSFNQDHSCFAAGTDHGFRIYQCDPFRESFRRDFDRGGIGLVEMLFHTNLLALVGGGPDPVYPPHKVMIWDDHENRCIGELSFRSEVRGVRLRRDRIIVVLEQKIFVYNFEDLKLVHQIETIANPKGLCAISQVSGSLVLVCPGLQKGQVRVEHYGLKRTKFIVAHDSRIACFALTHDGQLLATASTKGTLVRIFSTVDGTLLQEVRRGADRAEIYSLAFSGTAQWLAVSSDKGTVHVFNLKVNTGNDKSQTASDTSPSMSSTSYPLSFIRGVLPKYFSSEWSVAQFRLHEGSQYLVEFGHQKNTVVILGLDGSLYRCQFDPVTGGEMTQLEFYNFLKPEETF